MSAPSGVLAQGHQSEIAELKAALEAQRILNHELLERVEALERGQTEILSGIRSPEGSPPSNADVSEERVAAQDEMREEYLDLRDRLDATLVLGGYYDFEYINDNRKDSPGAFRQHHFTLLAATEFEDFRVFGEMEFEYGTKYSGAGGTDLKEAQGEFKLEQAWVEYTHSDQLIVRGGKMHTPTYGIVHQWPNLRLPTRNPLMYDQVFPETFVGLKAYGATPWQDARVSYQAYVANGVSDFSAKKDTNENKAVGGQLALQMSDNVHFDTLDLGINAYTEKPPHAQTTTTWGVEAQFRAGPWEVLSEFAMRNAEEDRTGFYLQPSFRFDEQWTSFYRYDLLTIDHRGERQEHTIGVNFRPLPEVALKLEYYYTIHSDGEDYSSVAASVAVAF